VEDYKLLTLEEAGQTEHARWLEKPLDEFMASHRHLFGPQLRIRAQNCLYNGGWRGKTGELLEHTSWTRAVGREDRKIRHFGVKSRNGMLEVLVHLGLCRRTNKEVPIWQIWSSKQLEDELRALQQVSPEGHASGMRIHAVDRGIFALCNGKRVRASDFIAAFEHMMRQHPQGN
jgi:hypothetical protein